MPQEIDPTEMPDFPETGVFFIRMEARAAYRLRSEFALVLHNTAEDGRRFDMRVETEYDNETRLPRPILRITVTTTGQNLTETAIWATSFVRGYLNCLAIATNAYVEDAQPIYAADVSRVSARREFWQAQSQIVRQRTVSETRLIPYDAATAFALEVLDSRTKDRDRLVRAVQQYVLALRQWTPDTKVISMGHAFMGVEALTTIAKRSLKLSDDELYELEKADGFVSFEKGDWYRTRAADQRSRRIVTFRGDSVTLKGASELSNGLEHGYGDYETLIRLANEHGEKTLGHLRNAIITLSGTEPTLQQELLSEKFASPIPLFSFFGVFGTLTEPTSPEEATIMPLDLAPMVAENAGYDAKTGAYTVKMKTTPRVLRPVGIEEFRFRP